MSFDQTLSPLQNALVNTIAYFDLFDYPLTLLECKKWLYVDQGRISEPKVSEIRDALHSSPLSDSIEHDQGFYVLKGRQQTIDERQTRALWADRKFIKARKVIRTLRALPFIRMVAVCNTLAMSHSRNDSDIDLFILVKPGRVWTARFFATGLIKLLGLRPNTRTSRDTICLSFYTDLDTIDLLSISLNGNDDIYLAYWIDQLVPVYDPDNLLEAFRKANGWMKERLPFSYGVSPIRLRQVQESFGAWLLRNIIEGVHVSVLGAGLEKCYRSIQRRVLPDRLRELANKDSRVIMNDHQLKFHENDRRRLFFNRWRDRRNEILSEIQS